MPTSPRSCLLLAAAMPAIAMAVPVRGAAPPLESFRLPEREATPEPDRQGPVAPDVPESRLPPAARPEPETTPAPTPAPAQPRAEGTPAPAPIRLPQVTPPSAPASRSAAGAVPAPSAAAPAATTAAEPGAGADTAPLAFPTGSIGVAPAAPSETGVAPGAAADRGLPDWPWLAAAGAALLAALAGLAVLVRRRRGDDTAPPVRVPEVRKPAPAEPRPAAAPESAASPVASLAAETAAPPVPPAAEPKAGLAIEFTPLSLSMTLVNAALGWRVELANHSGSALEEVELAFDMISAHKDLSPLERLSGPAAQAERRRIGRIEPGQSLATEGDVRLPFPHIVPIWQGETALLMPLVRLRVAARGMLPVTRTVLVGQPSPRTPGTLLPFRLDLGPRVYPELARKAVA